MPADMLPFPGPRAPQTIRIDPEVWFALQQRAVPFVETPNDVLRRLLGLGTPAASNERALVNAPPPTRVSKGNRSALYFINTDAKANAGHSYHEQWLARSVAVTSGPGKFRN